MSDYVSSSKAQIKPEAFHRTIDGSEVDLYTLKNSNGLEATITNYGGIVVSLKVPDKNGKLGDVVLGYDTLNDYIGSTPYFGALIGRYVTESPRVNSRSTVSNTNWRRITIRTLCTAVAGDLIRWSGKPKKPTAATDQLSS
jgi:Aldose 1-epimerase